MKILSRLMALAVLVVVAGVGLAVALRLSVYADAPIHSQDANPPTFPTNPLLTPTNGATVTDFLPVFDWADADDPADGVVSYTLIITGPIQTSSVTTTGSIYTPTTYLSNGDYTWSVQAHDGAGNSSNVVTPAFTFTIQATWYLYLPLIVTPICPATSSASYNLISISGPPADHPDYLHGDLNLGLRGYDPTAGFLGLVDYSGGTDPGAPQLAGLFSPNRFPGISAVYRVYGWDWGCGPDGCRGPLITNPPVTLVSLNTTPGEPLSIPERGGDIAGGGYKVMVLYAEPQRITLGYTSNDTVANGYAIHLENICVDPNLLALYRAQTNGVGWHVTGRLPGLRINEVLGTAMNNQIEVAVRDRGTFLDPRSRKDWWQGY